MVKKCNYSSNCLDREEQCNKGIFFKLKQKKLQDNTTFKMEGTIRANQKREIVLSIAKCHARMFNVVTNIQNFIYLIRSTPFHGKNEL